MEQFLTSLVGNALLVHVIMAVIPLLFILPYALVVIYLEMKIAAHMQERLRYWQMDVQNEIAKVMQEYQTMQSIADTYKRQADTFNAQVASAFGKPVASRVAGKM